MKTKLYTIAMSLLAVITMVSCDSFLDDQPRGYAIPETTANYEGMFNTIDFMNVLCEDYTKFLSPEILMTPKNVDDLYRCASSITPPSAERAFKFETNIYEPAENCELWAYIYKKVYTFNSIINGVMDSEGGSEAEKLAILAEARVGRAWLHFVLAQAFSKPYNANTPDELTIPIVKEADTYANDFERASMKEFYDFVTTEMEEAVPHMKDLPLHRMRAYAITGMALLGKMYWMMGEYDKALEPLRKAYEKLKNDNTVSYIRNFNTLLADKYGHRELSLNELYNERNNTGLLPYAWADPQIMWVKQNPLLGGVFYVRSYNAIGYYITPEHYAKYDEYDLRRDLIPTHDSKGEETPYPLGTVCDYANNYGVSVPEVYLALAECEARAGDSSRARSVLEDFRSYRMLTGHEGVPEDVKSKDDLIRFCVDEQDREFLADIKNFYNLRRLWNDPLFQDRKPYTHNFDGQTYTMKEENLYLRLPEGVLKWNEQWRDDPDQ